MTTSELKTLRAGRDAHASASTVVTYSEVRLSCEGRQPVRAGKAGGKAAIPSRARVTA